MKIKHLMMASSLLMTVALQSCIKEKDLYQAPPTTYSELGLKLDGDYLVTELPMSRAADAAVINEKKSLVGIAISMISKDPVTEKSTSKPYAYGIFELDKAKDPENLKIRVIDGYKYRVSCTMIANATDSIEVDNNGGYSAPYDLERNGNIKGKCTNKFLTAEQADGLKFLYNIENPKIATKKESQNSYARPFIERYHGLIEELDAQDGKQHQITLYRRFFGVKFKQTGLESGYLRIKLNDAPDIYLNAAGDIHQTVESEMKMVSMKNLTAKIPEGKDVYLTENVSLEVFWKKAPGEEEKQIIKSSVNFKRNFKHTIVLTDIDNIGTPGNIGIQIEDPEEMKDDPQQDIPWQGDN